MILLLNIWCDSTLFWVNDDESGWFNKFQGFCKIYFWCEWKKNNVTILELGENAFEALTK